jgi:hypothetical protein
MRLLQVLLTVLGLLFLSACASTSPTEIVHVPQPVYPPAAYLAYCHAPDTDTSIRGELLRLNGIVLCERSGKDAISAWERSFQKGQ